MGICERRLLAEASEVIRLRLAARFTATLLLAFPQAIVDSDGQVLESVESGWRVVIDHKIFNSGLETTFEFVHESPIVPMCVRGDGLEGNPVLSGALGLSKCADLVYRLLYFVDRTEVDDEVVGELLVLEHPNGTLIDGFLQFG